MYFYEQNVKNKFVFAKSIAPAWERYVLKSGDL